MTPSCFLIDLDDTLYAEVDYVDSGYRAIAPLIAEANDLDAAQVLALLRYEFRKYGRTNAFDRLYKTLKIATPAVPDLVAAYRAHAPDIAFYPDADEALARLTTIAPVAIVTDGDGAMQRAKVKALGLESRVGAIVYCWDCDAPKPATKGYLKAAAQLGADPAHAVIVGDDPFHDVAAAQTLNATAIRVRTGRLADLDWPVPGLREFSSFAAYVGSLSA